MSKEGVVRTKIKDTNVNKPVGILRYCQMHLLNVGILFAFSISMESLVMCSSCCMIDVAASSNSKGYRRDLQAKFL